MSTYAQYYQYQNQPQVLFPNPFEYGQYDPQRSKTPTSLINHTGHSPGPLSTPPLSRNTSQPPEQPPEQLPDQMIWDDPIGSISDSPTTSVGTPDNDAFEIDMLDAPESMRSFYQNQNGAMVTTHMSQGTIPALETNMLFSNQASQPQQYHTSFSTQSQLPQNAVASQPYNHSYSQNYTSQPPRQDPWSGQGPPRNPNVPRSDIAVFDPASDQMEYSDFVNFNVDNWMNDTEPNYLVSPITPAAPPHGNHFYVAPHTQVHGHSHIHNHRPVGMGVAVPPPFPDSQSSVSYNPSSQLFTESYITESQFPPPLLVTSSIGQTAYSPFSTTISPQTSAPSPGGSEDVCSSESGTVLGRYPIERYRIERFDSIPEPPPRSPFRLELSPTRTVPEVAFDASPEPESERRQSTTTPKGTAGRPGGRALGTHLEPEVAKAAHDMRKIVACWHCVLQRDKCGAGDICDRCIKRSQRPNADCGLGCSRVKLIELSQSFLPTIVTQMHEDSNLKHFVSQHVRQWHNTEIPIYLTCGQHSMPRIAVKVYEFIPEGAQLIVQLQYNTDPVTHKRVRVKKQSPPLGMVHINQGEEMKYDKYISDIVDNHLDAFGALCWKEDDNDFQEKLFKLLTRVKPKTDEEAKLLREVFRLIVSTFIMSHTLTIAEETKITTLRKMRSYTDPNSYVQNYTSPRMTNRQLKYFFSRLQRSILATVLNKLQQIFKSSKGCDKWLAAFVVVVGMCMAHEDQQKTIHLVMETRAVTEGLDRRDAQVRADIACREIDVRMGFIAQIFRWKYNRKCNPLRDADHDWEREVGFGDASSVSFVRQVAQLVKENIDFLQVRQSVSISSANQTKYTSRLVGQFLLSFWLPT